MPEARKIIFNIKNNMRAPTPSSDAKPNRTAPRRGPGSIEAQIGLLVIFGILAAFILLEVAGSLSPFADAMEFQARFANIKDLREFRKSLRLNLIKSDLCDKDLHARNMEKCFKDIISS